MEENRLWEWVAWLRGLGLDGDGRIMVILPLDTGIYGWVIAILACTLRSLNQGSSLAILRSKILRGSCAF